LTTVAGLKPRADSSATHACTSGWRIAASGTPPKRGRIRELKYASSRATVEGRRSAALPHQSSSHAASVVRPAAGSVQAPRSLALSTVARNFSASTLRRNVLLRSVPSGAR
jgi:hypothetical protein